MNRINRRIAASAAFVLATGPAWGAAFQLREGDPDWLANAFAGSAAKTYDAGSAWNNPAGMVDLTQPEIDQALNYFDPGIKFQGVGVNTFGKQITGGNGGDAGPPAVTAGMEAVFPTANPNLAFGAATEVPFGLRTSYTPNFVGRYQSLVSAIEDFELALSAAYRVTPQFSIGGGPIVSYFRARLTQALNVSAFVPTGGDPVADIHGDAFGAGYHFGGLYEVSNALHFGIDYKSRITYGIAGKQEIYQPPKVRENVFISDVLSALNGDASTNVTTPDVLTMSTYYDINPAWAVMGTVQWTHWSLIQDIVIDVTNPATHKSLAPESTPINFNSTWMESVGVNYRPPMIPKLMLQAGILYDEGANTDLTRGPRLPDEARVGTSGGFTYALTPRLKLRAAYLHEFPTGDNHIDYSNNFSLAGRIIGKYVDNADVVSAGVAMQF